MQTWLSAASRLVAGACEVATMLLSPSIGLLDAPAITSELIGVVNTAVTPAGSQVCWPIAFTVITRLLPAGAVGSSLTGIASVAVENGASSGMRIAAPICTPVVWVL